MPATRSPHVYAAFLESLHDGGDAGINLHNPQVSFSCMREIRRNSNPDIF